MPDIVSISREARQLLAKGLNALQSDDAVQAGLLDAAEPIAKAMGALHRIERSQGADLGPAATEALTSIRAALSILQTKPQENEIVIQTTETVASCLGQVFSLTKMQAPAPAQLAPIAVNPAPQQAVAARAVQQPQPQQQPRPQQPVAQHQAPAAPAWSPPQQQQQPQPAPAWAPPQQQQPQPVQQQAQQSRAYAPQQQQQQSPPAPAYTPPQQQQPPPAPAYVPPQQQQPPPVQQQAQQSRAYAPQQQQQQPPPAPAYVPPQQQQPPQQPAARQVLSVSMHAPPPAELPPNVQSLPQYEAELGTQSPSNFFKGLSGNDIIQFGGLFIATYNIPKIGQAIRVHVTMPGDYEFEAIGAVKWTRVPRETFSSEISPPGFGVQFTHISPEAIQLVHRYARNREPMFHDDL